QRVEVHGDGAVGRHDIPNAGDGAPLEGLGERDATLVDRPVDPVVELDEQRRVAERHDAGIAGHCGGWSARSSFSWMPPKPPFDISTTRSPGRCSRTMPSTMSSIESASRASNPRSFRSRTRRGTDSRSASGSVDRNTGAISTWLALPNALAK